MDTAISIAYDFSSHEMANIGHRRMVSPQMYSGMPFYANPAISYEQLMPSGPYVYAPPPTSQPTSQPMFSPITPMYSMVPQRVSSEPPMQASPLMRPSRHDSFGDPRSHGGRFDGATSVPHIHTRHESFGPSKSPSTPTPSIGVEFKTEVDTLMKAIQLKAASSPTESPLSAGPPQSLSRPMYPYGSPMASIPESTPPGQRSRKKYECTFANCSKVFYQKTHLDIHIRAHTGDKPFLCREPGCGQRFSQLGNLKTHERRHTGEKPYSCDICKKRFAQRGNVRAHKITHEQAKPFVCRLDDCGKQFTQLGNLKSHQNKFHAQSLRVLTAKFSSIQSLEQVTPQDQELWEYFASLYKNSNKGIKGRGKDRKIFTTNRPRHGLDSSSISTISSSPMSEVSQRGLIMDRRDFDGSCSGSSDAGDVTGYGYLRRM